MQLEKEIMGERLTGLYLALDNIIGNYGLCIKIRTEHDIVSKNFKETLLVLDDTRKTLSYTLRERDMLMRDHIELSDIKSDLLSQKEKMAKVFKEKFTTMQKELTQAIESREIFKVKLEETEKKYIDLSEEFKKFKHKVKIKFTSVHEKEEKFCKNCQKSYFESENYNWSCRVHASKITGDTWWCCGKAGKDAVGCMVSRHMGKEEEDPKEDDFGIPTKFCSACKDYGHNFNECFRDPNVKTNFEPGEELRRLKDITKNKRKAVQSVDMLNKMSFMLSNRSTLLQETLDEFKQDDGFFDDVKEIKQEIEFHENFNKVHIEVEQPRLAVLKKTDIRKRSAASPLSVYTNLGVEYD